MGAASGVISVNGARLPVGGLAEMSVGAGFALYVLRYPTSTSRKAVPAFAPRIFPTAREAIRAIRVQVRGAHVFGMTPGEIERAIEWVEDGWITALGLLNAGEQCGFNVVLGNGALAEWSVQPLPYLEIRVPDSPRHNEHGPRQTELSS
ncbi:hypothetical protein ACWGN5_34825 [Streptomyces sp. NPDC055815]